MSVKKIKCISFPDIASIHTYQLRRVVLGSVNKIHRIFLLCRSCKSVRWCEVDDGWIVRVYKNVK